MLESLFGTLPPWMQLVIQLIDYLLKAGANWRDTPEGAAEWEQVTSLYEIILNADEGRAVTVEPRANAQATSKERQTSQARKGRVTVQPLPDDFDYSARG